MIHSEISPFHCLVLSKGIIIKIITARLKYFQVVYDKYCLRYNTPYLINYYNYYPTIYNVTIKVHLTRDSVGYFPELSISILYVS